MQLRQRINSVLGLPSIVENDKAYWLDPKNEPLAAYTPPAPSAAIARPQVKPAAIRFAHEDRCRNRVSPTAR
jgi:hypothetical protein